MLKYTNWDLKSGEFADVPLDAILSKSVVIATLGTAGALLNQGVPRGHFDVIVVDEAGQALEPECLAPAAGLLGSDGQLVLAGDPAQLGPIIHARGAREHGLETSMLERLSKRAVYAPRADTRCADPRVLVKLLNNYRAHDDLLELPNRLFYGGEMRARADAALTGACLDWEGLPTRDVPLLFDGIVGRDTREANSPSWFNPDEVVAVVKTVQRLLQPRAMRSKITAEEIGVIAPYNKQVHRRMILCTDGAAAERVRAACVQVQRIRARLIKAGLGGVKVGSTEMFQGQERRVIILSTVRSSEDYVEYDARHNLGFLDNPKRFNVAITRACALLIVIGNPAVLAIDKKHWGALQAMCFAKGAYRGVPPPRADPDADAEPELLADIAALTMSDEEEQAGEPCQAVQQGDMAMPAFE